MVLQDGLESSTLSRRNTPMKKIMTTMLGLSLVLGAASYAFAQEKTTDTSKMKKTGKKGKKTDKKTT
jgi:uncharacterized protein YxeA